MTHQTSASSNADFFNADFSYDGFPRGFPSMTSAISFNDLLQPLPSITSFDDTLLRRSFLERLERLPSTISSSEDVFDDVFNDAFLTAPSFTTACFNASDLCFTSSLHVLPNACLYDISWNDASLESMSSFHHNCSQQRLLPETAPSLASSLNDDYSNAASFDAFFQ